MSKYNNFFVVINELTVKTAQVRGLLELSVKKQRLADCSCFVHSRFCSIKLTISMIVISDS